MDKEKLHSAAQIAASNYYNLFNEPVYDYHFYDGFMDGANWLLSQPLSERLTEEEKELIRREYMQGLYLIRNILLKLFGADFFLETNTAMRVI